jgi:hypothetical protein
VVLALVLTIAGMAAPFPLRLRLHFAVARAVGVRLFEGNFPNAR